MAHSLQSLADIELSAPSRTSCHSARIGLFEGLQRALVLGGGDLFQDLAGLGPSAPRWLGLDSARLRRGQSAAFRNVVADEHRFQRQRWLGALMADDVGVEQP